MTAVLEDRSFQAICELAYRTAGLKLGENKRQLVVSRLQKRLPRLGLPSFAAYVEYVRRGDPDELRELINCLTTNKTDFFREPHHFAFLAQRLFAEAKQRAARGGPRTLRIWSAGCSTGEEPYTIALVADAFRRANPGWSIEIVASDIDTDVLAHAARGTYTPERVELVPVEYRDGFERTPQGLRVRREIRELVSFQRINFMDDPWPLRGKFDAIFCRNVTIYFDRPTQDRLYHRLVQHLEPHGYFMAGHSENLSWLPDILRLVGQTVYAPVAGLRASTTMAAVTSPTDERLVRRTIANGQVGASKEPCVLRTVLGTCVSACLWDPVAKVGGMNHFMLAEGSDALLPARFGVHAMELLINELMHLGADRRRLVAKALGASYVSGSTLGMSVADRNAAFVRSFLAEERIPLLGEKMGADAALEVEFQPHTGRVFARRVEATKALIEREIQARNEARAALQQKVSDVELF